MRTACWVAHKSAWGFYERRTPWIRATSRMPSMTNCTAIAAIRSPITRPTARVPARPILRKIRSALCNKRYVARTDARIPANTNSLSSGAVAGDDIKIMTVVLSHQLHPAAALVHGEVAAAGGPFELIPGDDLEFLAAALREPQRGRAPNLARLEALHRGDLPRVLERDLFECRHVPSLRCAPVWRRADGCTTTMLQVSFVCLTYVDKAMAG